MDNKLYKGLSGAFLTLSLFHETNRERAINQRARDVDPVFSLYDDIPGLINCRKTFIEEGDPTGYKWAVKYLHSWEHWERLLTCHWFAEALEFWRRELKEKTTSEALEKIRKISNEGSNDAQVLAAAKYLAEEGWKKSSRGKPRRKSPEQAVKDIEQEDANRIGLKLVVDNK